MVVKRIPVKLLKYHGGKDVTVSPNGEWSDLRSSEYAYLPQGQYKKISLGISMVIPEGYEVHITARRSTFEKWGIIIPSGLLVIEGSKDSSIPWEVPVLAMRDTEIFQGDRIVQFRLVSKQPEYSFI